MRITARAEYAVRAMVELAAVGEHQTLSAEGIASRQGIPRAFLLGILGELRRAGLVASVRGSSGGWKLARPAEAVTLAMVVRAVEGPLAQVSETRPEEAQYQGRAEPLRLVWVALRASIREVLEHVTIDQIAGDTLPEHVLARTRDADAWTSR
ncbi:RrF2 family transcriptional regulator [Saccharopolyspora rosea]|uniref:RrF2 family transcriptional regulator n=1 Tax=Saccharopolyspora rosea TaxID=524884 RepID=A0ABW3FU17_9PSEU|nr:Rrf2 family transcriptional regulator [Saccharopolyspora rosea]